ncbi:hypothetical protein T12_5486 [Trichinella patagoniensis]|uniref:Reverse transcriptase domain-containing protein n=1 Tax=Trichinella patagoniensis TaxID=990121 RepID=A0A0V0ZCJ5_9BILA|nr:hypothetical protein T12_5486 [Trichinella patagoniensis]
MMTLDSISELLERCQEAQDAVEAVITDDEEQKKEIQKNEEVQLGFDICQTSGLEHSELYRQSPRFPSFWEQFNAGIHSNAELADVTKFICDEILIGRPNGDKTLRELHDELVTHVKSLRALNRDTSGDRNSTVAEENGTSHGNGALGWKRALERHRTIIDYYYHFIEDDRRGVDDDCLVSVKSTLEWILCGQNSRTSHTSTVKVLRIDVQPQYDCEKYRRFWKLESIEIMDQPEVESPVERSMTINRELLSFHNAKYVTRLFWKRCSASLNNYHAALKRFEQLKAGLRKEPTKKREYENILQEYIDNGYVEEIGNLEGREGRTWHLPHRAVFKMDKNTSKCRIIFDGSHRCEGVSLNKRLDPGPPITADLNQYPVRHHEDVLTNRITPRGLRCDKICMAETGRRDAMYLSVLSIVFWVMLFTIFGHDCRSEVLMNMYVDDILLSCDDESSGQKMVAELTKLLKIGGFDLSKWSSNCADVLSPTPQTESDH